MLKKERGRELGEPPPPQEFWLLALSLELLWKCWPGTRRPSCLICLGIATSVMSRNTVLSWESSLSRGNPGTGASSIWGRALMVGPQLVRGLARETLVVQAEL